MRGATEGSRFDDLARDAADRVRTGQGTQAVFDALAEAASSYGSETLLTTEVNRLLATDRLAGQFAVRACRTAFSIAPFTPGVSLVLAALPCVVVRGAPTSAAAEIQGWLRSEWLGLEHEAVRVSVAPHPAPTRSLAHALGRSQVSWAHVLSTEGKAPVDWPNAPQGADAPFAAGLWLVALRLPSSEVDALQARLWSPTRLDASSRRFVNRIEALAEEQGALLKVLPPASWANAFPLARAAAFRLQAQAMARSAPQGATVTLHYDGVTLQSHSPAGRSVNWGAFPEETREDLEQMLARARQASGLSFALSTRH